MPQVKMLTLSAGPFGVRVRGSVVDVTAAESKELIGGGFAEAVKVKEPPKDGKDEKDSKDSKDEKDSAA